MSDFNYLCFHWDQGYCSPRRKCEYLHPKRQICKDFQDFQTCDRKKCKFLHITKEEEETYDSCGALPMRIHEENERRKRVCYLKGIEVSNRNGKRVRGDEYPDPVVAPLSTACMRENKALKTECKVLEKDMKTLKDDNKTLKADKKMLKANNELLKTDNQMLKTDNQMLKANTMALKADNEMLKNDNNMITADQEMLKANVADLQRQVMDLRQMKDTLYEQSIFYRTQLQTVTRVTEGASVCVRDQEVNLDYFSAAAI